MLESTRETLGIDLYEGALHFRSFYFGPFLAKTAKTVKICPGMTISWHLQMIEGWFWYQTSSFGMNFLKNYMKIFFEPKKAIFWPKGGHFGYP